MAEEKGTYNTSDKLAIALSCLAGVMAIGLFLAEKTPVTVISLLVLLAGLLVYPVLHFVKRPRVRSVVFIFAIVGIVVFGWCVWPKNKPPNTVNANAEGAQTANIPQQPPSTLDKSTQAQQPTSTPASQSNKKQQSATAKVQGNRNTTGAINQEGNNNTAVVGNNNVTTIGPSADEIASKVLQKLVPTVQGGFHEVYDEVSVSLGAGGMTARQHWGAISETMPFLPFVFGILGEYQPIVIRRKGDRLAFSVKVSSGNIGDPVIDVEDSEVKINSTGVQRNWSENAFEVATSDGTPLFQMIRKNPSWIVFNGIFPVPPSQFPSPNPNAKGPVTFLWAWERGYASSRTRPNDFYLKPIFKYPWWKYPGQFADQ